jgi:hydroxyethylthiazole kinase-like uncharacterized protein yjeF
MIGIEGQPILTAAAMRAAEERAIAAGSSVQELMARAGAGVAAAVQRIGGGAPVLVLCGPGNNGGDGYVAATRLRAAGVPVRVVTTGEPKSDAAKAAGAEWGEEVETLAEAESAPLLVDCLFGTGLSRPLDDAVTSSLGRLANAARLSIAVDLPSGISTDDGKVLSTVPAFDVTLALGALKPSHLLQSAVRYCGEVRLIDIGIEVDSGWRVLSTPELPEPGPDSHKYTRGMVAVIGGAMPGAGEMAALAALRSGAGYVLALSDAQGEPHAVVRRPWSADALDDKRIGAVVIGPGLGRDDGAATRLDAALKSDRKLVIDGDALAQLDPERIAQRGGVAILTPHQGEFDKLFGKGEGGKIDRALDAARRGRAIVTFKGADTVIAAPDGRISVAPPNNSWLSTAGTGDALAGTIGAQLASGLDPFDAACAGVWLHGEAARRLGKAFIADDLANALTEARGSL